MSNENTKSSSRGLKLLTRPHSIPMKTAPGGKEMVRDNSKHRKYKVKGE